MVCHYQIMRAQWISWGGISYVLLKNWSLFQPLYIYLFIYLLIIFTKNWYWFLATGGHILATLLANRNILVERLANIISVQLWNSLPSWGNLTGWVYQGPSHSSVTQRSFGISKIISKCNEIMLNMVTRLEIETWPGTSDLASTQHTPIYGIYVEASLSLAPLQQAAPSSLAHRAKGSQKASRIPS
jgi:hypothetical protein